MSLPVINVYVIIYSISLLIQIHSKTIPIVSNTAKLTTSQTSSNDASMIILNTNDVSIVNNAWDISVHTQIGFHMLLDLSSTSWGFHPTLNSTITLSIDSSTSPSSPDKDLILSFSVNNNQYFTIFVIIDNNVGNGIWPTSGQPLATGSVHTFVNKTEAFGASDRRSKASEGTGTNPLTPNNYIDNVLNSSPITISIENIPCTNNVYISLQPNNGQSNYIQQCIFTSSFTTNKGMQVYIGGDDNTDDLISLTSFIVQYTVHQTLSTTPSPTDIPTTNPSKALTINPTKSPSNTPTNKPTYSPSINPSTIAPISTSRSDYIDCDGNDECTADNKVCQDNIDCIIDCIGYNACQYANITCPNNAHCQLNCGGYSDDCKQLIINAKTSKSLHITCGDGPESCDRMKIYCPVNNGDGKCRISGLNGNNVDSIIHLYAVQGLTDINILYISNDGGQPVAIHILCTEDYSKECYITGTNVFNSCVTGDIICNTYTTTTTNRTGITDNKPTSDYIVVTPRPTQRPSVSTAPIDNGIDTDYDLMMMIIFMLILVIILLICCGLSCMRCVGMKCKGFYMIYIVVLRIMDVITDIILSQNIVIYSIGNRFSSNILLLITFGSVVCIVVSYTIGIISIYWIYNIPTNTASVRPQQWFKKYIVPFFLFFLITNDTYLLIELFSSSLFGSDIFDSGHTVIEKQQIKMFKILSIITGNVPQIVIQCIFGWIAYSEHNLEAIIIILLAVSIISSIFVIITFIRLQIKNHKFVNKKNHNLITYQLKVKLMKTRKNRKSKKHQLSQIKKYRGDKTALQDEFTSILGIKKNELQIGHIELIDDGCLINLVQRILMTPNDEQYIEDLYKNITFAEVIEDIFDLEWNVAVKLVINQTKEVNKQITLEQTHNIQLNHNIFNIIENGDNHHHHIQIGNISPSSYRHEFDNNYNNNNKQYHLQVIQSPISSKQSATSQISISTMDDDELFKMYNRFKMVDNPSNSSNKYEAEEQKIEIDDDDEDEYYEYYDEQEDEEEDDSVTHASGDCSQYSPHLMAQKTNRLKVKHLHPRDSYKSNAWIKDNNHDDDVPELPSENKSNHTFIIKENVQSRRKKRRKKRNVKQQTYFD